MPEMAHIGRMLIITGAVLAALGLLLSFSGRPPWLGKLPGDIVIQRRNFTLYFPVTTSMILSVVLSVILWLFGRK